ncbi:DNA replication/repair protein RecF [Paraglaciecola sp. 2405UD69-4]|uniref:DNA replication/repair protein RecF n=1 Tax=Paraglaciecola sp. 2405UD69-4 TaxID=3391836 RepID=UPI0039C98F36
MKLDRVQISDFRNLDSLSFRPNKNLNVFIGENGSGKSSILEALHYLGFARSFRTSKHKNVIQNNKDSFTVYCSSVNEEEGGTVNKLGISRARDDTCVVNINGVKSKKASDLVSCLPIQIFTPQSSDLLLGAPKLRRRYLDWLLFHVEHNFNLEASIFSKSLKQLNAIYKQNQNTQPDDGYWIDLFCKQSNTITDQRHNILTDGLIPMIYSILTDFLPEFCFEISYYRGWEKELTLEQCIAKNSVKDRRNGFVSVGPHKADLRVKIDGTSAHEVLSRGQLRMLVASMQLAQTLFLQTKTKRASIFLLDDIGAELDEAKRSIFVSKLVKSNTQLFVTAIDTKQLDFVKNYNDKTVFHVEHGHVREEI